MFVKLEGLLGDMKIALCFSSAIASSKSEFQYLYFILSIHISFELTFKFAWFPNSSN